MRLVGVTALNYSFNDDTLSEKVATSSLAHTHARTHTTRLLPGSHLLDGSSERKISFAIAAAACGLSLSLKSLYSVIEPGCRRVVLQPCDRRNLIKVRRAAASLSPYCDASANTD